MIHGQGSTQSKGDKPMQKWQGNFCSVDRAIRASTGEEKVVHFDLYSMQHRVLSPLNARLFYKVDMLLIFPATPYFV